MTFDPQFQDRKCAATGALNHKVDVEQKGDRTQITTEREMSTAGFPDFVKSFVGSSLSITQVDEWGPAGADGSRDGTITVSIASAPLKFAGTLTLRADGAGSIGTVDGELKAGVPLIGGRIEKAAAPAVMAAVEAEQKTAFAWITKKQ